MENSDVKLTPQQQAELEKLGVVLCYLHGSVAKGTARTDSDVDIAVLFDRMPDDPIEVTGALIQALHGLAPGREKDIAILNEASPLFCQSVAALGIRLYARSEEDDVGFQIHTMHKYEDSRHIANIGRQAVMAAAGI